MLNGPFNSYGTFDIGGDNNTTYYSFLNKLRIAGNDANTIWQTSVSQPSICLTTSNASAYIYHSIGNGTIKTTTGPGGFGINTGYNVNPRCHLEVAGRACIHNGSPLAAVSNFMQSGSLAIGGTNANYGGNFYTGGAWTGNNTAGLLLECQDNTEIVVHDSVTRLASLMYYEGGSNKITIGRNMGWDTSNVSCPGPFTSSSTIRGAKYVCAYGETIPYNYNWNSTGQQGWFIGLNDFWSGNNGGCAYLTIAMCLATTSQYCCFCRVLVNAGGGAGTIIIDSKNPTSGVYEFFLTNVWDAGGTNALRVRTGTPGTSVENLRYKIYG